MRKNMWITGAALWITVGIFSVSAAASTDYINGFPGEVITFGAYEQDGNPENGPEPIEWQVLVRDNGELTLLSVSALDVHGFFVPGTADQDLKVTWENSDLRAWLQDEFSESAFSEVEWSRVIEVEYENEIRTRDGIAAAIDETKECVTIPSYNELTKYFPEKEGRETAATEAALADGAEEFWWLRTTSGERECYAVRTTDGVVGTVPMDSEKLGVRPMIRISMYQNDSGRVIDCESEEVIKAVQQRLNDLGFGCGEPDGKVGSGTSAALIQYQMQECIPVSGTVTAVTVESLGL